MCLISIGKSLKRKLNCPVSSFRLLFQEKSGRQASRVKSACLVEALMWVKLKLSVPLDVAINCTGRAVTQLKSFSGNKKMLQVCSVVTDNNNHIYSSKVFG